MSLSVKFVIGIKDWMSHTVLNWKRIKASIAPIELDCTIFKILRTLHKFPALILGTGHSMSCQLVSI